LLSSFAVNFNLRRYIEGASTGAAFSFGTGPRSALGGRKAGDALPGPGDYSADTSDVVGRCRLTFSNPR